MTAAVLMTVLYAAIFGTIAAAIYILVAQQKKERPLRPDGTLWAWGERRQVSAMAIPATVEEPANVEATEEAVYSGIRNSVSMEPFKPDGGDACQSWTPEELAVGGGPAWHNPKFKTEPVRPAPDASAFEEKKASYAGLGRAMPFGGPPLLEQITCNLYDTVYVTEYAKSVQFFSTPIGAPAGSPRGMIPKSIAHTNMQRGGALSTPRHFQADGLLVHTRDEKVLGILEGATVRLYVGCKDYVEQPLEVVLQVSPIPDMSKAFSLMVPDQVFEDGRMADVWQKKAGLLLLSEQVFGASVSLPDNQEVDGGGFYLKVYLIGRLWREVQ